MRLLRTVLCLLVSGTHLIAGAQSATTTAVNATPANAPAGSAISLSATVGSTGGKASPPGSVTFYDGSTSLGTGLLASSATAVPKVAQLNVAVDQKASGALLFGDLDGDGRSDIVSYSASSFQVFLNKGTGVYTPLTPQPYPLSQPTLLDFNHDGMVDIVSLSASGDSVVVLAGSKTGVYASPTVAPGLRPIPSSTLYGVNSFTSLAVADLTGTGLPYILLGERTYPSELGETAVVSTYKNNGNGTFTYLASLTVATGTTSYARSAVGLQVADVNADGKPDLLATVDSRVTSSATPTLAVALGYGDGTFRAPSATVSGTGGCQYYCGLSVVTGDFGNRGKVDIAFTSPVQSSLPATPNYTTDLTVYPGNGDGTFGTPRLSGTVNKYPLDGSQGYFPHLVSLDIDGDGLLDLVDSYGYAYLGKGDFTFTPTANLIGGDPANPTGCQNTYGFTCGFTQVSPIDFNADGLQDLYFSRGGILLGQSGATAVLPSISTLTAGTHSITGRYSPTGSVYSTSTSSPISVIISAVVPTVVASTQPALVLTSQAVTLSATVTGTGPKPVGTVTFTEGAVQLGSAPLQSLQNASRASITYTFANSGTHTVTASYSGDSYNSSATATAVTTSVTSYPTTTRVSASSSTLAAGATITLSASVGQSTAGINIVPAGSMSFLDGDSLLGTATIVNGSATFAVSLSAVGMHSITAKYLGDSSNAASSSAPLSVTVLTPFLLAPADGSSTTLTASYGGSTTTAITLSPQNGFTGSVGLKCSDLPAGLSCAFSPSTLNVAGTASVSTTLTVSASSTVGALRKAPLGGAGTILAGLLGSGLLAYKRRFFRAAGGLPAVLLFASVFAALAGCGGSNGGSTPPVTTQPPTTTPTAPTSPTTVKFTVVASSAGAQVSSMYTLNVR